MKIQVVYRGLCARFLDDRWSIWCGGTKERYVKVAEVEDSTVDPLASIDVLWAHEKMTTRPWFTDGSCKAYDDIPWEIHAIDDPVTRAIAAAEYVTNRIV